MLSGDIGIRGRLKLGIIEIMKKAEKNTELSNWNKLRIINECNLALIDLRIENTGTLKNAEA